MANTQIDITDNGTTTLATAGKYCDRNIDVNVAVRNGTHNRHYEVVNPTAISGGGKYLTAVSADPLLARVRDKKSLVVIYRTSGTVSCVKCVIATNELGRFPILNCTSHYFSAIRFNGNGSLGLSSNPYAINDDTSIASGGGRVYITSDGDFRIYGNTVNFAIPAGAIYIDILWGDD